MHRFGLFDNKNNETNNKNNNSTINNKELSLRSKVIILEWLNSMYSFANSKIRLLNIFQLGHSEIQIREIAKKGLLPRIIDDTFTVIVSNNNKEQFTQQKSQPKLQKYPNFMDFISIAHDTIMVRFVTNLNIFCPF